MACLRRDSSSWLIWKDLSFCSEYICIGWPLEVNVCTGSPAEYAVEDSSQRDFQFLISVSLILTLAHSDYKGERPWRPCRFLRGTDRWLNKMNMAHSVFLPFGHACCWGSCLLGLSHSFSDTHFMCWFVWRTSHVHRSFKFEGIFKDDATYCGSCLELNEELMLFCVFVCCLGFSLSILNLP